MEWLLLILVGLVFFFINKDYNPKDYQHIKPNFKQKLKGDIKEHEAGLLVALLAKVAKADGKVDTLEAELISHTLTDIANTFEDSQKIRQDLKQIYLHEKEDYTNLPDICKKYLKLTKYEYDKRLKVLEYLLNLAFIDGEFSEAELMITQDIAQFLNIKSKDYLKLVEEFKLYYQQKAQEKQLSLQKAYEILQVKESDDLATIKKAYRALVKKYHPDIIASKTDDKNVIDKATKKLQEINEAYELIKKAKNG
jgi:DnaJ like chaperone protein